MRIYYDETRKNIVLGATTRLFATGSLVASVDRGRISVVYLANNFREVFISHARILREDGTRAGNTAQEVVAYLNAEFNKSPFQEGGGFAGTPTVVKSGDTYIVPEHFQVLFRRGIVVEEGGIIRIDGDLIEV